jgi:hypothetical protein
MGLLRMDAGVLNGQNTVLQTASNLPKLPFLKSYLTSEKRLRQWHGLSLTLHQTWKSAGDLQSVRSDQDILTHTFSVIACPGGNHVPQMVKNFTRHFSKSNAPDRIVATHHSRESSSFPYPTFHKLRAPLGSLEEPIGNVKLAVLFNSRARWKCRANSTYQ